MTVSFSKPIDVVIGQCTPHTAFYLIYILPAVFMMISVCMALYIRDININNSLTKEESKIRQKLVHSQKVNFDIEKIKSKSHNHKFIHA